MTTTLIIHTIALCVLSLLCGILIGMTIAVNELKKHTPTNTQELYNNFLKKQVKK